MYSFFFFKQKTAYEMRISDWSSDVCSSDLRPEIKLAPRQIFTRSRTRADVARIIELYRRQGRFAATVEPQLVQLDQNRVDVVFEINEGPKSKVRAINIIGNEVRSEEHTSELQSIMRISYAVFCLKKKK